MNQIGLGLSDDGSGVNIKSSGQKSLFGTQETSKFKLFVKNILSLLKKQKEITNQEIVKFTIMEGFLPKHGKEIMEKLYTDGKLKVFDQFSEEVTSKQQWNIAEKISKTRIFRLN